MEHPAPPRDGHRKRAGLLPGLGSIRNRYLYAAGLMALVLLFAAMSGRLYVAWSTDSVIDKIQGRSRTASQLEDTIRQLERLEKRQERFILQPRDRERDRLEQALDLMGASLTRLASMDWNGGANGERELLHLLRQDYQRLRKVCAELVRIRLDVNRWFPVSLVLEESMLPSNAGFETGVSTIIGDLELAGLDGVSGGLYRSAVDLRYYWNRMISEFRLYIANRLGVFSVDSRGGMASRAVNIRHFSDSIRQLLEDMYTQLITREDALLLRQELQSLEAHHKSWLDGYGKVAQSLQSEGWRSDLVHLNRYIDPLIDTMRQRLSALQMGLDVESARDITLISRTAQHLSDVFLLIAMLGWFLIGLGYLIFERGLLRPVAQLTKALKAQAMDQPHGELPEVDAEETHDLLQAFQWMRQKVKERHSQLDHLAHHDNLTGLPNRSLFRDRLDHALQICERSNTNLAVLFIDLDRFKQVNDEMGHLAGDMLLMEVADRLRRSLRGADTVARLSGDEFAVLMENIANRDEVTVVVEKLLASLGLPYHLEGRDVRVSASIGIALGPGDQRDANAIIRAADAAMYEAKRDGREGFHYFSRDITERAIAFLRMERDLRAALAQDGLSLLFQPLMSTDATRVMAVESRLHWVHSEQGVIAPEVFLPVLEETGLIATVYLRILETVSELQERLRKNHFDDISIALNLTPRLLASGDFCERLTDHLRRGLIDPALVFLELTEDQVSRDSGNVERVLQGFAELGARLVLDHFGKGDSSLTMLRKYPFDMLKIHPDFIRGLPHDADDCILVKSAIGLGHTFGLSVAAEGVSNGDQVDFLRRNGCDLIQGPFFSEPLEEDELLEFVHSSNGREAGEAQPHGVRLKP